MSLTPWCRFLLEKLTGLQLVKKFPAFHGTRESITALTSVRCSMWVFLNKVFLQGGVVSTSPNPQARGPPLVGCPRLLIRYIRSYPHSAGRSSIRQPEDAPCCGDRVPLHCYVRFCYVLSSCAAYHTVSVGQHTVADASTWLYWVIFFQFSIHLLSEKIMSVVGSVLAVL